MQDFHLFSIYRIKDVFINPKNVENMKKLLFFAALYAGICSSCSNSIDTPVIPEHVEPTYQLPELDNSTRSAIASLGNVFASNLMLEMNKQVPDNNMMISPMSLQYALGMLSNGCDEVALKEITNAMGMNNYSLDMLNSFYYNLTQTLTKEDEDFTLKLANAIWIQENHEVGDEFIQNNKAIFGAEVNDIDFYQANEAQKTINTWADKATNGTIKELSLQINDLTRMVLANACYLKGKWTLPFNKKETKKETFHNQDGTTSKVDMMQLTEVLNFHDSANEPYMMVELPYGNQTFSMLIVLPKEKYTLNEILPAFDWSKKVLGGRKVNVVLPKFKIEAKYPAEIMKSVKELGINHIFESGSLLDIHPELFVGQIAQDTFIEVDEAGTEASAVTTIGLIGTSAPSVTPLPTPIIRMDRPFAFAIREKTTDAVLFMGKVVNM